MCGQVDSPDRGLGEKPICCEDRGHAPLHLEVHAEDLAWGYVRTVWGEAARRDQRDWDWLWICGRLVGIAYWGAIGVL